MSATNEQITLKDGTAVAGADCNGYSLIIAEDNFGDRLWLATGEHGILAVIRARSFDGAYEALLDAMPTIDEADVPEAYGFYGDNAAVELERAVERGEYPDLVEGYDLQGTASGTGIVDIGHCLSIRPLTPEDAREVGLQIRSFEAMDA